MTANVNGRWRTRGHVQRSPARRSQGWQRGRQAIAALICGLLAGVPIAAEPALTGAIRVRIHEVVLTTLTAPVEVDAIVQPFQRATLAAEIQGRVVTREAQAGSTLKAGERLLAIDPSRTDIALRQARMDAQARQVEIAKAEHDLRRGQELFARSAISQDRLDELRFAVDRNRANAGAASAAVAERERMRKDADIRAPFAGIVTAVHVHVGDYVAPGTAVATMADFSRVRVIGGVTAVEAQRIDGQLTASLSLSALAGQTWNGEIRSVGRTADPQTGTYPVEVWLDVPVEVSLRDGMAATMVIAPVQSGSILTVPPQAVLREGSNSVVYAVEGNIARKRAIVTGQRTRTLVEIRSGLAIGDQVVTEGHFALRDGSAVAIEGQ